MTGSTSTTADRLIRDQKQHQKVVQLWIFLGCIILFLTLINLFCTLYYFLQKRSSVSTPQKQAGFDREKLTSNASPNLWKRSATTLATTYRVIAFRALLPTGFGTHLLLSETVFICIYITSLLVWLLSDTRDLSVVFYEDRAAHLAACQLPLIVALAGKNNIISFLTGVSYEKLNILHRAAARAILLLLWVHAISRLVSGLPSQFDLTHNWVRSGLLAWVALTCVAILSLKPIRTAAFEFFFLSHIVLISIFLVSGYFHAREQKMGDYIWPALMLWALDRALRGLRIVWNNRLWCIGGSMYSLATVELVSSDTTQLTLTRRFNWKPGQHAYITLPTISRLPLEAHPFTIASIPGKSRTGTSSDPEDNKIVFLIRGRSGMTKRLRHFATRGSSPISTIPAFIDGPYGYPPNLLNFTTNILVAGGSGISFILPLFLNLLHSISAGAKPGTWRVVFVWAIRDTDHLDWILQTLSGALDASPSNLSLEPRIYITGSQMPNAIPVLSKTSSTHSDVASSTDDSKPEIAIDGKPELPAYSELKIIHGRPSIRKLLYDEISTSPGSISVNGLSVFFSFGCYEAGLKNISLIKCLFLVAGPSSLSKSIRRALGSGVAGPRAAFGGMPPVTLHVENFGL